LLQLLVAHSNICSLHDQAGLRRHDFYMCATHVHNVDFVARRKFSWIGMLACPLEHHLCVCVCVCVCLREPETVARHSPQCSSIAKQNHIASLLAASRPALPPFHLNEQLAAYEPCTNLHLRDLLRSRIAHNAFSNSSYSSRSLVALERRDPHPALLPLTPTSLALLRTRRAADHHRAVTSSAAAQHRSARRAWVGEAATAGRCAGQTQRPTGGG
jgi:hypothetical protein